MFAANRCLLSLLHPYPSLPRCREQKVKDLEAHLTQVKESLQKLEEERTDLFAKVVILFTKPHPTVFDIGPLPFNC